MPSLFLFVIALSNSGALLASELAPFFHLDSATYSEPVSINGAFDEWSGTYHGGERQWSSNWTEAGFRNDTFGISTLARYDIDIRFSKATADFYHSINMKLPLDSGRTYDIDIRSTSFNASGIRFSWNSAWRESGLKLETGISLMNARNLLDGDLRGQVTPFSSQDFDYSMNVNYRYDADRLFGRPNVVEPQGRGIAFDLRGEMVLGPRWHFDFKVRDLYSQIWWTDAPYTRASAATGVKTYDSNGYVESISPTLSGYEGYENYTQRLTPAIATELHAPISLQFDGSVLYRRQYDMNLWGLGAATSGNVVNWGAHCWPGILAWGAEIQWRHLTASLTFDNTNPNEIRTAWLNFEYR